MLSAIFLLFFFINIFGKKYRLLLHFSKVMLKIVFHKFCNDYISIQNCDVCPVI